MKHSKKQQREFMVEQAKNKTLNGGLLSIFKANARPKPIRKENKRYGQD